MELISLAFTPILLCVLFYLPHSSNFLSSSVCAQEGEVWWLGPSLVRRCPMCFVTTSTAPTSSSGTMETARSQMWRSRLVREAFVVKYLCHATAMHVVCFMNNKVHYLITAGVEDPMQHGRGVALADFNRDGKTDIVYGNWNGPHRLYIQLNNRKQRFKVSSDFHNSTCTQIHYMNKVYLTCSKGSQRKMSSHMQKA